MTAPVRWRWGEDEATRAVDRALAAGSEVVLHESGRRRIARVDGPRGVLLVKRFRVGSGPHPWRDRVRSLAGAGPGEAEARTLADREKVARVLLNRIADRDYLQLDSTVSYAAQRRSVTTTDAERASTSPYNTYTHRGMPPGPIANPGLVSIQAALTPATGTWRYFVAVNPETGETKFANTFAEHEKNVALFQAWCRAHPGKC